MVVLQNVSPPREGVRLEEVDITAVLDGKRLGSGTLCVAESRVSWVDGSGVGFSLDYPSISLHAISRDLSAYPAEHLYVQVNSKHQEHSKDDEVKAKEEADGSDDDEEEEEEEEDDDDDVSTGAFTEIRFVPNDKGSLEKIFVAMSECQALHPDPDDSDSDFDGDEYDVEEAEQGQIDLPTPQHHSTAWLESGLRMQQLHEMMMHRLTLVLLESQGSLMTLKLTTDRTESLLFSLGQKHLKPSRNGLAGGDTELWNGSQSTGPYEC
ncbi:hypothetical protein KOW79_013946 [Hemibagrus wyckioides]|uniref:Methylosome subunit pICln n=1 Tax=Hemibagrus wyckioides TaxID=337641 RepID=A0A9D3NI93_9TELE|nr:hypothetical protein KOW79_013946 [Hemibagrus wyckioides]